MKDNKPASQRARILRWMQKGHAISPLDALNRYGCQRLAARIWELRHKEGYTVKSQMADDDDKRYKIYWM